MKCGFHHLPNAKSAHRLLQGNPWGYMVLVIGYVSLQILSELWMENKQTSHGYCYLLDIGYTIFTPINASGVRHFPKGGGRGRDY